jgi:hypothetical protein
MASGTCPAALLVLWGLLCCMAAGCGEVTQHETDSRVFPNDYPTLHPQYRQWPSPARGITVADNDPTLMWPRVKGKDVLYDIRLSVDSSFRDSGVIAGEEIPWTVFNPHRALGKGLWYWQYRVHGKPWSPLQNFRVSDTAKDAVSASYDKFASAVPAAHPRLLVDPGDLMAFRTSRSASPEAARIIREADALLKTPLPDDAPLRDMLKGHTAYQSKKLNQYRAKHLGFDARDAIERFAEAYLLTGDRRYAERGALWTTRVASWDPDGPTGYSDFGDGACMEAMAIGFDSFYDLFPPGQKTALLSSIRTRGNRFYTSWVNDLDAKVLSGHIWQFLFHNLFRTALAVHGDLKDADTWLHFLYEVWLARAPILGGPDGGWAEGMSYFAINTEVLLDIPTVIKHYTGYDVIAHTPWYGRNAYWLYYAYPPGSGTDGFGDNSESLLGPDSIYLAYADALSKLTGSRVAATYARKIEEGRAYSLADTQVLRWFRLRYLWDVPRPDTLPDGTLPRAVDFPDVGLVEMHSDLGRPAKDLMVGFRSSPFGAYGHMLADQNTFNILYGGKPLFYVTGAKLAMQDPLRLQWYKATIGHNGILVDGKGQLFGPDDYGWIARFLGGNSLCYTVGDATMAYGRDGTKDATGLRRFKRHMLFLYPDIVVIYDELKADHPVTWDWIIHSPGKFTLDSANGRFQVSAAGVSAEGRLFSPVPLTWAMWDTMTVKGVVWMEKRTMGGKKGGSPFDAWHLRADNARKVSATRLLTVIRVNTGAEPSPEPAGFAPDSAGRIHVGGWTITAEMDTSRPALLTAVNHAHTTAFSSGGNELKVDGQTFRGTPGASKLAEKISGKWTFHQKQDSIPVLIQNIPPAGDIQKTKP